MAFNFKANDRRMDYREDRKKLACNHGFCSPSEAIKELYKAGFSMPWIGLRFEYTESGISDHLDRMGIERRPKGGSNNQGKLCNLSGDQIIFICNSSMTQKQKAKMFGLSQGSISNLINNKGYENAEM